MNPATDIVASFYESMQAAGLAPSKISELVADGRLHRFHIPGDRATSKNGWYRLHIDNPPSGIAGNWKTGATVKWTMKPQHRMTEAEREALRLRIENDRAVFEKELARRHADAARRAQEAWDRAKPADQDHAYLVAKCITSTGGHYVRQIGNELVLPVVGFDGVIVGLQYIGLDGTKRFTAGMNKRGNFIVISDPPEEQGDALVLAEGFATAVYVDAMMERKGHYCVVAGLDAGNLIHVATKAKELFPNWPIIVAADFDAVGMKKGREAASAVRGRVLLPPADLRPGETDWADYLIRRQKEDGEVANG